MKQRKVVIILVFMVIIFMAGTFLLPDKEFSKAEKRDLTTKDSFKNTSVLDGSFQNTAKDYVEDQFPLRDNFVKIYGTFQRLIGNKKIGDVYFGDDYLYEEYKKAKTAKVEEMARAINKFAKANPSIDIDVLIAPTQVTALEDSLPAFAPKGGQREDIKKFYKLLAGNISKIDVVDQLSLKNEKSDKNYYYHSDHHWTSHGAKKAFDIYAKKNLLDTKKNQYDQLVISNDFNGTLAAKTGIYTYPDEITVYVNKNREDLVKVNYTDSKKVDYTLYQPKMLDSDSGYNVFMGGNHPLVKIQTASSSGKNLMVIKDSYANSFIPFLTPYYSNILVVDPRYYYESIKELVRNQEITDVLFLYNGTTFFQDESLKDALVS